ncbi:MAG: hypothetical protein NTW87_32155, partial [Planctomycetota bacterium]|nr:hypothetical protein [Planctomycetota bacterium]
MRTVHDLSQLEWRLSGWTPHVWRFNKSMETGALSQAEIPPIPARVPGSVQDALRAAGILPDWNVGLNARLCEWVENRHWVFETTLPNEWFPPTANSQQPLANSIRLRCLGLDYCGCVLVNGKEVAQFRGSFVPHVFDFTPHLAAKDNRLAIVFECPPRWLGQFGYTSRMTEWKPRFNYTWDWVSRLVQTGIWDDIALEVTDGHAFQTNRHGPDIRCIADADLRRGRGTLSVFWHVRGGAGRLVRVALEQGRRIVRAKRSAVAGQECPAHRRAAFGKLTWKDLPVELWHPNGRGRQPLYTLRCQVCDRAGKVLDEDVRRIGFKHLTWRQCAGAPRGADPWLCVVNGKPVFLQGVNWAPIRPNFADVSVDEYRQRLQLYRDLGFNLLRVWGGGVLEKECFYELCDELGLLVWQEFPLSSSGVENWPPEDAASIERMKDIASSYIERRQHHVSLALWCGGNELQGGLEGSKEGIGKPVDTAHPMIKALAETVARHDPGRRFLP